MSPLRVAQSCATHQSSATHELNATYPDLEPEFLDVQAFCAEYTMTSPERMYALWQAVRHVAVHDIPGVIVECGVWRGGSSMVAALALRASQMTNRHLWLYDTFEGMSEPSEHDFEAQTGTRADTHADIIARRKDSHVFAYASLPEVQHNMSRVEYPAERVHYVEGKVEETIPARVPEEIAVLRLDTDWYESTRHELEHLWPRLRPGGVLIIDDYGHWAGARKAVDEFFAGRGDAPLLQRIDYTGRMGVKR